MYRVKSQDEEFLHLECFLRSKPNSLPFFPSADHKCRVGVTGPETWGLWVPGRSGQAREVRTRGAGAALTAGKEKAGDAAGHGRGVGAGEEGSQPGARDQSALPQGQERREGERAPGRGGSAGGRGSGPGRGARGVRDAVRMRGGASPRRTGGREELEFGVRRPPSRLVADCRGGAGRTPHSGRG